MQTVSFPGLGLTFHINKIAFYIGSIPVYWYGIILALGILLAIYYCGHIAIRFGFTTNELYDMVIVNIPISILGARLYYVIFNLQHFIDKNGNILWMDVINIKLGGLAIYGGIITSILFLALWCKIKHYNFLAFADLGLIGVFIGQIVGRLGNFINIEAYGYETTLPWRMRIPFGNTIGYIEVHPTFLYEMLWNTIGLIIVLLIVYKDKRKFDGQITFTYIAWYGFGRSLIEPLRSDSLYLMHTNIRISQLVGIVTFIIASIMLLYRFKLANNDKSYKEKLYVNTRYKIKNKKEEN